MNLTSNIKKIFLFILLASTSFCKPKGAYIDSKKLPKLIEKFDTSIVLLYEEWCGFSQNALKVFKQVMADPDFENTDIVFGFFDLKKEEEFKKFNSIKEIPEIFLYIKKTQIKYHGNFEKQELKNFIIETLQIDNIHHIDAIEDINELQNSAKNFFLFFGQKDTPRYHVFLEGHYSFPEQKFVCTDNTLIGSKLKFDNNSIYYYNQKEQQFYKYKKSFKRTSFMQWVYSLQRKSLFEIETSDFFERVSKMKKPYIVLFQGDDQKSEQYINLLHNSQQDYFEFFQAAICQEQSEFCKIFKNKLYFEPEFPSMYIMTFHKDLKQPLFYLFDLDQNSDLKKFIEDFQNGTRKYNIFSQNVEIKPDYNINEELQIVTRDYFRDFLFQNLDKDIILLFIDLREEQANNFLRQYQDFVRILLQNENNKKNLTFGYFDISKNSCDIFKVQDTTAQIIIYKQASLENQLQFTINIYRENFQENLLDQLDSRTTHRINFGLNEAEAM